MKSSRNRSWMFTSALQIALFVNLLFTVPYLLSSDMKSADDLNPIIITSIPLGISNYTNDNLTTIMKKELRELNNSDELMVLDSCDEDESYYGYNNIILCIGSNYSAEIWAILYHETGHSLIDEKNLNVDNEEITADQFAVYTSLKRKPESAFAMAKWFSQMAEDKAYLKESRKDYEDGSDNHPPPDIRAEMVYCWIYGSNPEKYYYLKRFSSGRDCTGEWENITKMWGKLD